MLGDNRKIDKLGRLCIPMEMRKELKIDISDPLEITCDGYEINIKKRDISCSFCNDTENLIEFNGKYICIHCSSMLLNKNINNNKNIIYNSKVANM